MISTEDSERFSCLLEKKDEDSITADELVELDRLYHVFEDDEMERLAPALERMRSDRLKIDNDNLVLQKIIQRRERLVAKLEAVLRQSQAERTSTNKKLAHMGISLPIGP